MSLLYFVYKGMFIIPILWLGFVAAVCSLCLICTVLHLHPLESVLQTPIDHALITWKFPLMTHGLCFMWASCLYQLSRLSVPIEMLVQPLYIYPFNDKNIFNLKYSLSFNRKFQKSFPLINSATLHTILSTIFLFILPHL